MFIEVEFAQIHIIDGVAMIQLNDDQEVVKISQASGLIEGINVIEDVEVDLVKYLQDLWDSKE